SHRSAAERYLLFLLDFFRPRHSWKYVQVQGNASEVPERASCCAVTPFRVRDGVGGSIFWGPHNSQRRGHLLWQGRAHQKVSRGVPAARLGPVLPALILRVKSGPRCDIWRLKRLCFLFSFLL